MVRRRAGAVGIKRKTAPHSPGPGLPHIPMNGGGLKSMQQIVGHESSRTTGLYDRRSDFPGLQGTDYMIIWLPVMFIPGVKYYKVVSDRVERALP